MLVSCGFDENYILNMPIDKFRLYLAAATYRKVSDRSSYIYDIVAVISGLFGKKDNKVITKHLKSLDM